MGENAIRIYNNFRRLFGVQQPRLNIPSQKVKPNHKLEYFLKWIVKMCTATWKLGWKFSVD